MIQWEISLGNLLTIGSICVAGIAFYAQALSDSRYFKSDIVEIKSDLKILSKIISDLAVQTNRLDNQGERLNRIDARFDELRHGKGFVS